MSDVFHRTELAIELSSQLLNPPLSSAVKSGLFLAAPRRTGKSTFLVADLVPALENAGALVIYVDLWLDIDQEPAEVITEAITAVIKGRKGVIKRLAEVLRSVDGISAAGMLSVSVQGPGGLAANVSITDALLALSEDTKRMIVLVIDEAQHAITTVAGSKSLFSLKAAKRMNWDVFNRITREWLPTPSVVHPWANVRFAVTTQGKSRVR